MSNGLRLIFRGASMILSRFWPPTSGGQGAGTGPSPKASGERLLSAGDSAILNAQVSTGGFSMCAT